MPGMKNAAPGTMLADMTIDIYASKKKAEAWILHDREFSPPLTYLEFDRATSRLRFFMADGSAKDLGAPIQPLVQPYLEKADEITFMRMEGTDIADAMIVPLKVL